MAKLGPGLWAACVAGVLMVSPVAHGGIIIDGNLSADWGVVIADNDGSDFGGLFNDIGLAGSHIEDQSDTAGDGGFVGPHYGGQNYDAEFLGVAVWGNQLYLAIATGQRPDNGLARYAPGDIRIVTDQAVFGLEVGGGPGGGAGDAITEGAEGTTYNLNGNGFTTGLASTDALQTAGSLWKDPTWINDPISPPGPTQMQMTGGSYVGLADYVFTRNSFTNQHAIIELAIGRELFGDATIQSIHWRPACGNDELNVTGLAITPVPEPCTILLAVLGVIPLLGRRPGYGCLLRKISCATYCRFRGTLAKDAFDVSSTQ